MAVAVAVAVAVDAPVAVAVHVNGTAPVVVAVDVASTFTATATGPFPFTCTATSTATGASTSTSTSAGRDEGQPPFGTRRISLGSSPPGPPCAGQGAGAAGCTTTAPSATTVRCARGWAQQAQSWQVGGHCPSGPSPSQGWTQGISTAMASPPACTANRTNPTRNRTRPTSSNLATLTGTLRGPLKGGGPLRSGRSGAGRGLRESRWGSAAERVCCPTRRPAASRRGPT
jgi:hypothetical protein